MTNAIAYRNNELKFLNYLKKKASDDSVNHESTFQSQLTEYKQSYYAGGTSRFLPMPTGVHPLGSDADSHYWSQISYFLMVERARYEDRENMVLGQGVNRLCSNVLQTGFIHDTKTPDTAINDDLKQGWLDYSNDKKAVDYEGEKTFNKIAEMSFRNMIIDGDISHIILNSGRIQTMEAHHMRSPWTNLRSSGTANKGIVHGVEIRNGKRVAYHYTPSKVGAWAVSRYNTTAVDKYNSAGVQQVCHVYNPKRFSQRRGVTTIAPIIFPTKYHDDLQFAALVNAKRQSFYAMIHEFDLAAEEAGGGARNEGSRSTHTRPDGTTGVNQGGAPGGTVYGAPGEKIKGFAPNVPGHSHFQHAEMLMTIMAINLDIPMIVFFLDASKGNFNTYRGVIQQAQQRYRIFQRDLIDQLHKPAYELYVRRRIAVEPAMRNAFRRMGNKIFRHVFTPEGWAYMQPQTDAVADDTRLSRNLISHELQCQERGRDWDDLSTSIVRSRGTLIEKSIIEAARLNNLKEIDDSNRVSWREIAYGQPGGGVRMSMQGTFDDSTPAEQPKLASGGEGKEV